MKNISLIWLGLFFCLASLSAKPTGTGVLANASFTASQTTICIGDSVTVTANDLNLNSYTWKVDGTAFNTTSQAGLRFFRSGTYTFTLIGTDAQGTDSTSQSITVVDPPLISVSLVVNETCPGVGDGMLDILVTQGVAPYSYQWSNGDTTQMIDQLVLGSYSVVVTDSVGCTATDTVAVGTNNGVGSAFVTSTGDTACRFETVQLTNASTVMGSFTWLQDGQFYTNAIDTAITFLDTGRYEFLLIGELNNCRDSFRRVITVTNPDAGFVTDAPDQVCPGGVVNFTNLSQRTSEYQWLIDNQPISQALDTNYTFLQSAIYQITLIAGDGGCEDTVSTFVNVFAPTASFNSSGMSPICAGDTVDFTSTSVGATGFEWFENGQQVGSQATLQRVYATGGAFTIDLIVTDSVCLDTASLSLSVTPAPNLSADITAQTCPDSEDGSIILTTTGGALPLDFNWSDGTTTQNLLDVSSGSYSVTITDNDGCVTTASYQINTLGGITSSFSYNIMSGGVQFNDLTSNASSWLWQFGDGQVSPNQNPMHSYQTSGSYQACLIVTDMFGCMDTSCQEVMVSVGLGGEVWKKLEVFPNPVQDLLQLRAEGLAGPEVAIRVRDLMGREILSQTASLQAQITLRVTSLPTGTYVLEVQDEKGNRYQGRFLKK